jgi:hypothetical protein
MILDIAHKSSHNIITCNSQSNNHLADFMINSSDDVFALDFFDIKELAEDYRVDLHTKVKWQNARSFDRVSEIANDLITEASLVHDFKNKKCTVPQPMSWGAAREIFPGCQMYMTNFTGRIYLDMIHRMQEDFDLTPVTENIEYKKFDNHINRHLPDDNIVLFTGQDNLTDIAQALKEYRGIDWTVDEVRECIKGQPFWILNKAFRDTETDIYTILTELYESMMNNIINGTIEYIPKAQQKIYKFEGIGDIHFFDMYMFYCKDDDTAQVLYNKFCLDIGIEPNPAMLDSVRQEMLYKRTSALGTIDIPLEYRDTIESIANVLLNVCDVKMDTDLSDIGWNDNCQLALKMAFNDIEMSFKNCYTIADLIKK